MLNFLNIALFLGITAAVNGGLHSNKTKKAAAKAIRSALGVDAPSAPDGYSEGEGDNLDEMIHDDVFEDMPEEVSLDAAFDDIPASAE